MPDSSDSEDVLEGSELGRKEHWEETYALELRNLSDTGDEGELWFGEDVMETMLTWTTGLLRKHISPAMDPKQASILDIGTGNGVLPLELAGMGYTNVTGSDYSEASIDLARAVADKRGITGVGWVVDDLLHTRLARRYDIITDKGTLDAVGLSDDAAVNRDLYRRAVARLLKPSGLLVITSCNSTIQELVQEFCSSRNGASCRQKATVDEQLKLQRKDSKNNDEDSCLAATQQEGPPVSITLTKGRDMLPDHSDSDVHGDGVSCLPVSFEYIDHVRTYPVFRFGGVEGSKVCTVAFRRM